MPHGGAMSHHQRKSHPGEIRVDIGQIDDKGVRLGSGARTNWRRIMTPRFYRIRVDGVLGDRFAAAFDAFRVDREDGSTVLSGVCVDSSAVFGVLERVKALGLDLLEVTSRPTIDHG